jgi:hypothetical protein
MIHLLLQPKYPSDYQIIKTPSTHADAQTQTRAQKGMINKNYTLCTDIDCTLTQ